MTREDYLALLEEAMNKPCDSGLLAVASLLAVMTRLLFEIERGLNAGREGT